MSPAKNITRLAFSNTNLFADLVLSVIFTIIYAMLFYVYYVLGYVLHNRISGFHCERSLFMFYRKSLQLKENLTRIFEFRGGGSGGFPYLGGFS